MTKSFGNAASRIGARARWSLALIFAVFGSMHSGATSATELPGCSEYQRLGVAPDAAETTSHRTFKLPVINHPAGTKMFWRGQNVLLRIGKDGYPICYDATDDALGGNRAVPKDRLRWTEQAREWRYEPFMRNGSPVEAVVEEFIEEQMLPPHRPMPKAFFEDLRVRMRRVSCDGPCPAYSLDIRGDGNATFTGSEFTDIRGTHHFTVAKSQAIQLLESIRAKDLWSTSKQYYAPVLDNASTELTLWLGKSQHGIGDSEGRYVGMPVAVTEFQQEVDQIGRASEWKALSLFAVERLKSKGFRFHSREGADLLARALVNRDGHDEDAMLALIELGVPTDVSQPFRRRDDFDHEPLPSLLTLALQSGRTRVADALLARGALNPQGANGQKALDEAFLAAIRGGNLALVQRIWDLGGARQRPSLWFEQSTGHVDNGPNSRIPVLLALTRDRDHPAPWDGLAIARWLVGQGCDPKARDTHGDSLLHIAASTDDVELVRWVLTQGIAANAPGDSGSQAIGYTYSEDVSMALLEAGTDLSRLDDTPGFVYRDFAVGHHWQRVIEWLDAHPVATAPPT